MLAIGNMRGKSNRTIIPYLVLPLMLVLPIMALIKIAQSIALLYLLAYLLGVSSLTVYLYWSDKRKAESNAWRTPETTLHLHEFLGGWAAAFFAQRIFRHKISKEDYQFAFWFIGCLHQYLSFDYLHNWKLSIAAFHFIEPILK
jgi:uncharacterized membrane protein YsdA (DUF1294 family)